MKQLKDVDSEFLNWFLDLLDLDINRKIKILESKNINFKLEFSTKLNKHPIDLEDKKIDKNNLFKPEGFLKIRYNHRADSKIYFKSMNDYLTMILVNDSYILFVRYDYEKNDTTYFSFNKIDSKNAETLISDMVLQINLISLISLTFANFIARATSALLTALLSSIHKKDSVRPRDNRRPA